MRPRQPLAGRGASVEKALAIVLLWLAFAAWLLISTADALRGLLALAARNLSGGGAS